MKATNVVCKGPPAKIATWTRAKTLNYRTRRVRSIRHHVLHCGELIVVARSSLLILII